MKERACGVVASAVLTLGVLALAVSSLAAAKAGNAKEGKKLYAQTNCGVCHGAGGRGDGPAAQSLKPRPTNFTNSAAMSRRTDKQLFDAIKSGGPAVGQSDSMPAYKGKLTDNQIHGIVAYLRTLGKSKPAKKPAPKPAPRK